MAKPCIGIVYGYQHSRWIGHKTGELFALLKAQFEARGIDVQKVGVMDLKVEVIGGQLTITDLHSGRDMAELGGLYFANWRIGPEFAMGLAQLMLRAGKPIVSEEVARVMPMGKLGEAILLSDKNLPVIDSVFMRNKYWLKLLAKGQPLPFAFPFILKSAHGTMGMHNHLVKDASQLTDILSEDLKRLFVAQPFIPNDGDWRIIVIGGKVRFAMIRRRAADATTHVNNTSQGGTGTLVDLKDFPPALNDLALKAAAAVGRSSFAGVDIVEHKDNGKLFVLEINKTPQMETGANTYEKVTALVDYFAETFEG
ncbi:MAG TPA: hypothetical protein VNG90_00180 [Candidatus Acidoferrum sp.]|nr:hypothetical protein [Candidatus Acidoferrum sp.]